MKSIVVISCITVPPDTEKSSSSSVFTGKNLIDLLLRPDDYGLTRKKNHVCVMEGNWTYCAQRSKNVMKMAFDHSNIQIFFFYSIKI